MRTAVFAANEPQRPSIAGERIKPRTANIGYGEDTGRQVEVMRDWDSAAALGGYLGITDAGRLADRARSVPGRGCLWESLDSAAALLAEKFTPGELDLLLEVLHGTDFKALASRDGDRRSLLSEDVYGRFSACSRDCECLPARDVFNAYLREYLDRFTMTLRAILYAAGVRREIISLEHPAVKDNVSEISHLTCRAFGEMKPGEAGHGHFSTSLTRYVQTLLDRHGKGLIDQADCAEIMSIMDRISAYPGYYRLVEHRQKVEAMRPLIRAISALRTSCGAEQEKMDLLAALGMLLFIVFPSRGLVRFLTAFRPGAGNRYLQYEHYALLAVNYLLMGKRTAAAAYCARACETAPGRDMKAYALTMEGCISLERHDCRNAIVALEKAMDLADDRKQRSLVAFYLGVVRFENGESGSALNCFREARAGADNDTDVMSACCNMGTCYMLLGDMGRALHAFEEAMARGEYSGRGSVKHVRSVASNSAGIVYISMREYDLAKDCFGRALRDARQTGNARMVADLLMNIGLTHKAKGEYAPASTHFIAALNYAYTIDYLEGVLYARDQIGQTLALQGKHDEERSVYQDIARRHPGIRGLLMRKW